MKPLLTIPAILGMLLTLTLGCNSPETAADATTSDTSETSQLGEHSDHEDGEHTEHQHGDHDHGDAHTESSATDMEKMTAALADFSPEDRESAMKQHFCPVTGEMLGTMGAPEKVDVNGQTVWICCDGCKDKLLDDPDTYLAELSQEPK